MFKTNLFWAVEPRNAKFLKTPELRDEFSVPTSGPLTTNGVDGDWLVR